MKRGCLITSTKGNEKNQDALFSLFLFGLYVIYHTGEKCHNLLPKTFEQVAGAEQQKLH